MDEDKKAKGTGTNNYNNANAPFYEDLPKEIVELLLKTHPLKPEDTDKQKAVSEQAEKYKEPVNHEKDELSKKSRHSHQKTSFDSLDEPYEKSPHSHHMSFDFLDDIDDLDIDPPVKEKKKKTNTSHSKSAKTELKRKKIKKNPGTSSKRNISIVFMLTVFVALLSVLVSQNNSLNTQLEQSKLQISNLQNNNDSLQEEIKHYEQQLTALSTPEISNTDLEADMDQTGGNSSGTHSNSSAAPSTYTVERGDNLSKISKKLYGSEQYAKLISDANNIRNPNEIREGMVLTIPSIQ